MPTTYWFVFMCRSRAWNPPEGIVPPAGKAWETVCVPGKIVACGSTKSEADSNLEAMIRASWAVHPEGPLGWWADAKAAMGEADKALCSQFFMTLPDFASTSGMPIFRSDPNRSDHAQLTSAVFSTTTQAAGS